MSFVVKGTSLILTFGKSYSYSWFLHMQSPDKALYKSLCHEELKK